MAGPKPTDAFARVALEPATVGKGARFGRLHLRKYPDSLGYGKTGSRFSDPRRRVATNRFGLIYLGTTLKVCFVEAILRDQRNGAIEDFPIEESELGAWRFAQIEVGEALKLVDLREDGAIRLGVPSDVAGAASQALSRAWSLAFYEHPDQPDGVIYPSRLNEETNLAIYDRAISKLSVAKVDDLITAPGLASALSDLGVSLTSSRP